MDALLLSRAVEVLRRGGLVAFATETVYGLGADATSAEAVSRIFAIKGRPATNPLIVHVAGAEMARRYAASWPEAAERLAGRFWPGPLTLVLPRASHIVPQVSAGLGTVGLRAPDHPIALELLAAFGGPLAAPSANRSTRVSPTTAEHVRRELGDAVDLILDGGPCRVGIESTVLDLSTPRPTILRPGSIAPEQIEAIIGPIDVRPVAHHPGEAARSPGQQPIHYAPNTPTYRFETADAERLGATLGRKRAARIAIVLLDGSPSESMRAPAAEHCRTMPAEPQDYARVLYATLHELDALSLDGIYIELPPATPPWAAVRDRLSRASKPVNIL